MTKYHYASETQTPLLNLRTNATFLLTSPTYQLVVNHFNDDSFLHLIK